MSSKRPSPNSNTPARSSKTPSPATSGQPRAGSTPASRPSTPGPGGQQPRTGTSRPSTPGPGGQQQRTGTSRPSTPGPGGQLRTGGGPPTRPSTPGPAPGQVSQWSSDSSSPSSGTGSPSPPRKTTSTTTATDAANHLDGLCVTIHSDTPPRTETPVNDDSPLFLTVAAAANLGLRILESKRGKGVLVQLGVLVVNSWTKAQKSHLYPPAQLPANHANMTPHVTAYLKKMRSSFVPIFLTNDCTGEGAACKFNWAQPTAGQPNNGLADYVGSQAGIMHLNKFIFETIVEAAKQIQAGKSIYTRTYEVQMALMGMTIAHELCHFFVGYLAGYELPNTPPEIKYLQRDFTLPGGVPTGESGRWWEAQVLGGETRFMVEPLSDPALLPDKHPLGYRQAGDLWLFDDATTRMTVISRESITGILNFDFSEKTLPLKLVGESENTIRVKATRLHMHEMRLLALNKPPTHKPRTMPLTKAKLDAHNALRKRNFGASDLRRLRLIPSASEYLYKSVR